MATQPTPTQAPSANAGSTALPFLPNSIPQIGNMKYDGDNTAAYTVGGAWDLETPGGDLGLLDNIILRVYGTITPNLGATPGQLAWSVMQSFFTGITLKLGDTRIREAHPFYFAIRNHILRRRYAENAHFNWGFTNYYARNYNASVLPALTGSTALDFVWELEIPVRWIAASLMGALPTGDSTTPVKLELVAPKSLYGVDPQNNLILAANGATATISATIEATYDYRIPLSFTPLTSGESIATPVVGNTVRVAAVSKALSQVGSEIQFPIQNFKTTTLLMLVLQDGNANADAASGTNGTGLSTGFLSQLRLRYNSSTPEIIDLDNDQKFKHFNRALRTAYGEDLPDGVIPIVFGQQNWGDGFFNEPNLDPVAQLTNFSNFKQAYFGVTVASGQTLNSAGSGLARGVLWQEWLEPVGY